MSNLTNEQFLKLPKYAQKEITRLKNNVEYYKKQVQQINGEEYTNIFIEDGMNKIPLPKNSTIIFQTTKEDN